MANYQRSQTSAHLRIACWSVILVALSSSTILAADAPWSVQKLNENQPWDRFVGSPLPIRIEGRLGTSGGGQFRLTKCDAKFTVDNDRLKQISSKSNVEVKGQFRKNNGKLEFAVDELKVVPSFIDQFEVRSSKLKLPTSDDWIELGDWAAERAKFYDDLELMKKAKNAYLLAMEAEYKTLKATDSDGRFQLAKRFDKYQLSNSRRMELIHEGFRIQWRQLQKVEPRDLAAWQMFAATLADQLAGATESLKVVAADLKDEYERNPETVYQKSKDDVRNKLHRLFFVSVTRKIILQAVEDDGKNGDQIADQLDSAVPEEHEMADAYRVKKLEYREAHLANATRSEVESLALAWLDRKEEGRAHQILSQWVKSHERRLRQDGVVGLMQLADEYLELLNDEQQAIECLIEVHRIDPTFEQASSKLSELGYRLASGKWLKKSGIDSSTPLADPKTPLDLQIGMSAASLRTLLGQPRSLTRAITARGITEVWSFGPAGSTPLVVRLERKKRDLELKVTAFSGQ